MLNLWTRVLENCPFRDIKFESKMYLASDYCKPFLHESTFMYTGNVSHAPVVVEDNVETVPGSVGNNNSRVCSHQGGQPLHIQPDAVRLL